MLPCIETYQKVDLRTITLDVPPQEVGILNFDIDIQNIRRGTYFSLIIDNAGSNSRLCDGVGGRGGLLPGVQRHHLRGQRGERPPLHPPPGTDHPQVTRYLLVLLHQYFGEATMVSLQTSEYLFHTLTFRNLNDGIITTFQEHSRDQDTS